MKQGWKPDSWVLTSRSPLAQASLQRVIVACCLVKAMLPLVWLVSASGKHFMTGWDEHQRTELWHFLELAQQVLRTTFMASDSAMFVYQCLHLWRNIWSKICFRYNLAANSGLFERCHYLPERTSVFWVIQLAENGSQHFSSMADLLFGEIPHIKSCVVTTQGKTHRLH